MTSNQDETAMMENLEYRELSDSQQKLLAILPIPSAILSIFGSIVIIVMAFRSRQDRPWTPYYGLLTAMSACNILSALTLSVGSFLFPEDTSNKVWAFGNDTTCTATGFLTQLSTSAFVYNAMLGFYFLASTRLGLSDDEISRRLEPAMHYTAAGIPLLTAFAGLFADAYGERQSFISCWVKTCPFDENGDREDCFLPYLDLVFGRALYIFILASLIVNNLVIWVYSRKQIKGEEEQKRTSRLSSSSKSNRNEMSSSGSAPSDPELISAAEMELQRKEKESKAARKRRLRFLSTQAILFVWGSIICNTASFVMLFVIGSAPKFGLFPAKSGASPYVTEMELPHNYYGLMIAQAILYPLQGFVNLVVYLRPAYVDVRKEFPQERRFWIIRRAILGSSVEPLPAEQSSSQGKHCLTAGNSALSSRSLQIDELMIEAHNSHKSSRSLQTEELMMKGHSSNHKSSRSLQTEEVMIKGHNSHKSLRSLQTDGLMIKDLSSQTSSRSLRIDESMNRGQSRQTSSRSLRLDESMKRGHISQTSSRSLRIDESMKRGHISQTSSRSLRIDESMNLGHGSQKSSRSLQIDELINSWHSRHKEGPVGENYDDDSTSMTTPTNPNGGDDEIAYRTPTPQKNLASQKNICPSKVDMDGAVIKFQEWFYSPPKK
eukprot:scaffold479_cov97-Cylindrotheca_fusiformis.AAC.7